jgi:sugar lactone lactonase YvrE
VIGEVGAAPGQLRFPQDIALAPDGSLFLCEYGNHRVSRFSRDGEFIACYGRAGRKPGEFNGPRAIAVSQDGLVFVADTDNHRIQRMEVGGLK